MLVDGFERTYDGKLKCRYCNYATRGTARLIEHIRIHTGKTENWSSILFILFVLFFRVLSSSNILNLLLKVKNPIDATCVLLPQRTNATWRHTCALTQARNLTSVSCAPSAAAIAATFLIIGVADTNSSPWRGPAPLSLTERCSVSFRREEAHLVMAAGCSSTSAHHPWYCKSPIQSSTTWVTSLMISLLMPTSIRRPIMV